MSLSRLPPHPISLHCFAFLAGFVRSDSPLHSFVWPFFSSRVRHQPLSCLYLLASSPSQSRLSAAHPIPRCNLRLPVVPPDPHLGRHVFGRTSSLVSCRLLCQWSPHFSAPCSPDPHDDLKLLISFCWSSLHFLNVLAWASQDSLSHQYF